MELHWILVGCKNHEKDFPTLLGVSYSCVCLKIWRHDLYERYDICMDHKILEYLFNQNELNMGQRRWLKLLKDYDCSINYHLHKAMSLLERLVESLQLFFNYFAYNLKENIIDLKRLRKILLI